MSQKQNREYSDIVRSLDGDAAGRVAAWNHMENSTAITGKGVCPISFLPVVFDESEKNLFEDVCSQAYSLMTHVLTLYKTHTEVRSLFRLDTRVRQLIETDTGCNEILPVARLDAIYNPDTAQIHFCEFNTDASGGMAETVESSRAIKLSLSYREFSARHKVSDIPQDFLMDTLVSNFRRIYDASPGAVGHPHVAVGVLFDTPNACVSELEAYIPYFKKYNMDCSVYDVRNLKLKDGCLYGTKALAGQSNVRVDAIWRFVIVVDMIEHWDEVSDFVTALKEHRAVMVGSFLTQVVHDKQLFALLHSEALQEYLTQDERLFIKNHIPRTYFLNELEGSELLDKIRTDRTEWVVKPCDWYASQKVHSGLNMTDDEWNALIDTCIIDPQSTWIVQKFMPPYETDCIPLHGDAEEFSAHPKKAGNILGLYLYCGRFSGIYMRQGYGPVIGTAAGELCAPVIWTE